MDSIMDQHQDRIRHNRPNVTTSTRWEWLHKVESMVTKSRGKGNMSGGHEPSHVHEPRHVYYEHDEDDVAHDDVHPNAKKVM